jgi:hypothetical protein
MIDKPSDKEQEYFLKIEMERLKKLREEHLAQMAEGERRKQKELHWLRCAKCGQRMESTRLGGVEVEICPDCGGVYLDAGELDKVVDEQGRERFGGAISKLRSLWGG